MTAIPCHQCGRPNGASAKKCIWCNASFSADVPVEAFGTTTVEADYLEGIDRLDDPGPVRLVISPDGIEVVEVLPGSRSIKIPAASILEANLTYSTDTEESQQRPWWRRAIEPLSFASTSDRTRDVEASDYILTIKYRDGDEVRTGVFSRSDRQGLMLARKLAGILGKLAAERQTL